MRWIVHHIATIKCAFGRRRAKAVIRFYMGILAGYYQVLIMGH